MKWSSATLLLVAFTCYALSSGTSPVSGEPSESSTLLPRIDPSRRLKPEKKLKPGNDQQKGEISDSICFSCEKTVCPSQCCTPKWYPCRAGKRCCSGWRCVNWKYGKRCEPSCVKKWYPCDRGNSYCCSGWRCRRWKYGKRCEPR